MLLPLLGGVSIAIRSKMITGGFRYVSPAQAIKATVRVATPTLWDRVGNYCHTIYVSSLLDHR